jgi:hypothetical protein
MASKINGDIKLERKKPGTRVSVSFSLVGRKPKPAGAHDTAAG